MSDVLVYQQANGVHVIALENPTLDAFNEAIERLVQMYQVYDDAAYVILDLRKWVGLPVLEIGHTLRDVLNRYANQGKIFVAIMIDTSAATVVNQVWKTILRREDIQYFTQDDKADLWLRLERHKLDS